MDEQTTHARPEAVDVDARKVVLVGLALWLLALVLSLVFLGWLDDHGHRRWLWISLDGFVLGLIGLTLMAKHRREGRVR